VNDDFFSDAQIEHIVIVNSSFQQLGQHSLSIKIDNTNITYDTAWNFLASPVKAKNTSRPQLNAKIRHWFSAVNASVTLGGTTGAENGDS